MTKIGVIGYGHIGRAITYLLQTRQPIRDASEQYEVTAYDIVQPTSLLPNVNFVKLPAAGQDRFDPAVQENDIIIVATPYTMNVEIAEHVAQAGKAYFDMTEDNVVTDQVHALFNQHGGVCMTQCGLAPGAVGIVAHTLMEFFQDTEYVRDVQIRVGALPLNANNEIKYYLSWSPEGLINEYCNPCRAIKNYRFVDVEPLEGYETIVIDGLEYEAFNTSGGVGSFLESVRDPYPDEHKDAIIQSVNYKTIRYKGHCDHMKFLMRDLELYQNKNLLVNIFRNSVPYIHDDVIVIFVQVTGYVDGQLRVNQYVKKIYGSWMEGLSAIQLSTASGICAAVEWYHSNKNGKLKNRGGVLYNHELDDGQLHKNPFWKTYMLD